MKKDFKIALAALVLAAWGAPARGQTYNSQHVVIDSNPLTYQGSHYAEGDRLEKTVDFFTSTTVPSVVLGFGTAGGPGGLWLYQGNGGITSWQSPTAITSTLGSYYERSKAIYNKSKTYPDLIVSAPGSTSHGSTIEYLSDQSGVVALGIGADLWQITGSGAVYDVNTARFMQNATSGQTLTTGATAFPWTFSSTLH